MEVTEGEDVDKEIRSGFWCIPTELWGKRFCQHMKMDRRRAVKFICLVCKMFINTVFWGLIIKRRSCHACRFCTLLSRVITRSFIISSMHCNWENLMTEKF